MPRGAFLDTADYDALVSSRQNDVDAERGIKETAANSPREKRHCHLFSSTGRHALRLVAPRPRKLLNGHLNVDTRPRVFVKYLSPSALDAFTARKLSSCLKSHLILSLHLFLIS